jgi:hypothetical protein
MNKLWKHSQEFVAYKKKHSSGKFADYKDPKKRNEVEIRAIGVCGEYAYGKFTNQPIDLSLYKGRDKGSDFPDGAQVKTVHARYAWYEPRLSIPKWEFDKYRPKKYVSAKLSHEWDHVWLMGEISGIRFDRIKVNDDFGFGDRWVVYQGDLDPIGSNWWRP